MSPALATPPERATLPPSRSHAFASWSRPALIALLMGLLFWWVLFDMARDWWNVPALSQGMLLPPLALYVAWQNRRNTLDLPPTAEARGLLLTAFACFTFVLGKLSTEFFMMRMSFVLMLAGMVWTFWGAARLRTLSWPFLLLATMVPLPAIVYNSLAAPLQLLASDLAAQIAQFFGVSVFRDGNIIHLASISLGVAEACSGLNSLSALVVGGVLLAYLLCTGVWSRVILCLAAIPLSIAVNILRVAGTAVLADYNEEFAMGFYHSFSGWLVFVVGFGMLYAVARILHAALDPAEVR